MSTCRPLCFSFKRVPNRFAQQSIRENLTPWRNSIILVSEYLPCLCVLSQTETYTNSPSVHQQVRNLAKTNGLPRNDKRFLFPIRLKPQRCTWPIHVIRAITYVWTSSLTSTLQLSSDPNPAWTIHLFPATHLHEERQRCFPFTGLYLDSWETGWSCNRQCVLRVDKCIQTCVVVYTQYIRVMQ